MSAAAIKVVGLDDMPVLGASYLWKSPAASNLFNTLFEAIAANRVLNDFCSLHGSRGGDFDFDL